MAKKNDKSDGDETEAGEGEIKEVDVQATLWRLARGQRRTGWVLLILLLGISGGSAYQIMTLQGRLNDLEAGVGQRAGKAFDDFARIQDQTAAIRGGVELLHREIVRIRKQVDEIAQRQRPNGE